MYKISGLGRKNGGARATAATPSLAPLYIPLDLSFKISKYSCKISLRISTKKCKKKKFSLHKETEGKDLDDETQ